jgi:putative DNA primase/helicase
MILTDDQKNRIRDHNPVDQVAGNWVKLRKHGRKMIGACPICSSDPDSKTATRFECDADTWLCAVCPDGGDVFKLVMKREACTFPQAVDFLGGVREPDPEGDRRRAAERKRREDKRANDAHYFREKERRTLFDIWTSAGELAGSEAARYLEIRGLPSHLLESTRIRLRCVPAMPYFLERAKGQRDIVARPPAMVAPIVGQDGRFAGLHFTYLDLAQPKGKAAIPHPDDAGELLPAKKVRGSKKGGHVELVPAAGGEPKRIIIGEGVEKVLAVWRALRMSENNARTHGQPIEDASGYTLADTAFWMSVDLGNLGGKSAESVPHPTLKTDKNRVRKVPGPVPDLGEPGISIPESADQVVIIGDTTSDRFTTECSIARAVARWSRPGRRVVVAWQPEGRDFDELFAADGEILAAEMIAAAIAIAVVPQPPALPAPAKPDSAGASRQSSGRRQPAGPHDPSPAGGVDSALPKTGVDALLPAAGAGAPSLSSSNSADPPVSSSSARAASAVVDEKASSRSGGSGGFNGNGGGGGGRGDDEAAAYELNRRLMWLPQTDLGNVERFVARFGDRLRWCPAIGWLYYDGKRWARKGADAYVMRCEHRTVRLIQEEAKAAERQAGDNVPLLEHIDTPPADAGEKVVSLEGRRKHKAEKQAKAKKMEQAAERRKRRKDLGALATALRGWGRTSESKGKLSLSDRAKADLAIHQEELDSDPFLINVQNGTLVVRRPAEANGEPLIVIRPHDPKDLITRIAGCAYDPDNATCPIFDAFFAKVQPIERQRRFLMAWHGLSLTGDTSEQKLVVDWGTGRNGKGTLMEITAFIAGDYADSVPVETFLYSKLQKSGGQATPDLAKLPGVRFLRCGEPEKGAKLGEALIKRVTGGDPIDARNLNKEFFTFYAQFKLSISCNYKPRISGTDDGIWGRMIMVPWTTFIPRPERDLQLPAKLRAEASGILNRLLDGLRDWLEHGLVMGEEIEEATAKYRRDSDDVGRFLEACCVMEPDAKTQSSYLWEVYKAWAKCEGGADYSNKGFTGILDDRGFDRKKDDKMYWVGVKLIKSVEDFLDSDGKPLRQREDGGAGAATAAGARRRHGEPDDPAF